MPTRRSLPFLTELPEPPHYNPVADAIATTADSKAAAALRLFASMPASTGVFANPVRYQRSVPCSGESVELSIRSFAIRGSLFEEDIITGTADSFRTIFVGLFGRAPKADELKVLTRLLADSFRNAQRRVLSPLAQFMSTFPKTTADVAMQYMAAIRKASGKSQEVRSRAPADLLVDLINVHLENCIAGACSSYMRGLSSRGTKATSKMLLRQTERFLKALSSTDPFQALFSLLVRRNVNPTEARILQTLGTIQIHHGSAGSNMVARYLASLHTKSIGDIFTAAQMTLDGARHFGAITDMTEFITRLERVSPGRQDEMIRQRAMTGNLPAFGHPEIALAGRSNRMELDPRPAIYLAPLFQAIDSGELKVPANRLRGVLAAQRIYQIAFVEGLEKPGRSGRLRVAPNTDFGAWIVQEILGIDRADRTFISYAFRGFGWMMDVREQLQQPIIRPVIPPDPSIVPPAAAEGIIPDLVGTVHDRLSGSDAFSPKAPPTR
jgi:citrate synthase